MPTVHVDLVTQSKDGKTFNLILVEEGPWHDAEVSERLHALQSRLYDAVDAVLTGAVAARYSQSHAAPLVIRVDCYGLPEDPVAAFLERFRQHLGEQEMARIISESE